MRGVSKSTYCNDSLRIMKILDHATAFYSHIIYTFSDGPDMRDISLHSYIEHLLRLYF